jgi:hypothetical protein
MLLLAFPCPMCNRLFQGRGPVPEHEGFSQFTLCPGSGEAVQAIDCDA